MLIQSSYLNKVLEGDKLNERVMKAKNILRQTKVKFDAIAFRGMSGAIFAANLATKMKKTLLIVRKPKQEEPSHAYAVVEGDRHSKKYIIVDDFVSTGNTLSTIVGEVKKFTDSQCVGVYCYLRSDESDIRLITGLGLQCLSSKEDYDG